MKRLLLLFLLLPLLLPAQVAIDDYTQFLTASFKLPANSAGYLYNSGTALSWKTPGATDFLPSYVSGQYLTNNGTTLSWGAISFAGYLRDNGTVPLTADWNVGAFDLTAVDVNATRVLIGNGSAAAPSMSFSGYTNTGWYYNTAGRIYGAVGGANVLYVYAGGVTIESGKNLFLDGGKISALVINNPDNDTGEVDSYTWEGGYGMLIVACVTDGATAVYRLEGTTLTAVSANAAFNTAKDNSGTYNVYFETGALKIQNKVGDNKWIKSGFYGL